MTLYDDYKNQKIKEKAQRDLNLINYLVKLDKNVLKKKLEDERKYSIKHQEENMKKVEHKQKQEKLRQTQDFLQLFSSRLY